MTKMTPMPNSCLQLAQQDQHLDLHRGVERGGRLVGEQQARAAGQRDRDHRALPQAARQLVRIGLQAALRRGNLDQLQQLQRARHAGLVRAALVAHHRLGDLVADGVDGIERRHRLLEDHRDGRSRAPRVSCALAQRADVVVADAHAARPAPRGACGSSRISARIVTDLARAGLADDAEHLAGRQLEGDAVDGLHRRLAADELDREVLDLDERPAVPERPWGPRRRS